MVDHKRKGRSGDSELPAKRQRVSRACDQCRNAREKCDGIQPICFTCASSNRDCTYTTNPKRRGIQPGYIRTLELTLAWTLCNVPGSEEAVIGLLQDEKGQSLVSSSDTSASNKLHKRWRKHVVSTAIDRVLSGESIGDLLDRPVSTSGDDEEEDEETVPEPILPQASFLTPDSLKTNQTQLGSDTFTVPCLPEPQQHRALDFVQEAQPTPPNEYYQLPSNHWRLIDVYFAYTHSWLPLASKERILKLCYSYSSEGLYLTAGRQSADHAELWSLMALSAIQNGSTQPQHAGINKSILRCAERLTYTVIEDTDVGHVGAMLNLSLLNIALQNLDMAWMLLGRAIRLTVWLQKGIDTEAPTVPSLKERIHGLLLGCFVVETVFCAERGIVPSLRSEQIKTLGLLPEEGLDEWQPWSGCDDFQASKHSIRPTLPSQARSTFNQFVKLCFILNDRICDNVVGTHSSAAPASLSNWLSTLPATLGPLHSMSPEQTSPQKLHLFLAFLVGRAYDSNHRETIEESLSVLDHFTYALGLAAMPPLFACFLQILKERAKSDGFQHNRLAGILTRFCSVWRHPLTDGDAMSMSPATVGLPSPSQIGGDNQDTPRPLATTVSLPNPAAISPSAHSMQLQRANSLQQAGPQSTQSHMSPIAGRMQIQTQVDPSQYGQNLHPRSHSTSDQSMDLDALFDHFTAIEGADVPGGIHPQFMQNLGFAPNANLVDLMTNDYSWALDPG